MAAAQFYLPYQIAAKPTNVGCPKASFAFYLAGTTTLAAIYADAPLTTPLENPVIADGAGRIPSIYLDDSANVRLYLTDKDGALLADIDPYVPVVGGTVTAPPGASVSSRTLLEAIPVPAAGQSAILTESGREGTFVFSTANLSAKVTADAQQGIYVAPSSDTTGASGAWVRKFVGPVNALWFGIVSGNASGANGAANYTAWLAMLATLRARIPTALIQTLFQPLEPIYFPLGYYEFSTTLDLTDGTGSLLGDNTGGLNWYGTVFKFPPGVTGIRTQRYNSSGVSTVDSPTHRGGDDWIIDGIALIGGFTGTESEAHGIHLKSRATIRNFWISDFEGDGIYCATDTTHSLADCNHIENGRIIRCRNGIYFDGGDSNICTISGISLTSNRQWSVWDSSFLGNSYFGLHAAANGITIYNDGVSIPASVVTSGGNRYFVIAGQEAGAATNAPSGTTADNTWWAYLSAGGVAGGVPAWTSGMLVRAGGSYRTDNANASNVLNGCYHEGAQGLAQLVSPTMCFGGVLAGAVWKGSTGAAVRVLQGALVVNTHVLANAYTGTDETVSVQLGELAASLKTLLYYKSTTNFPLIWRLAQSGADLAGYYSSVANAAFLITGPSTTQTFGGAAAVPHCFWSNNLRVGNGANARLLNSGSVAPTTGQYAKGDFILNTLAAAAGPFAWQCTTTGTGGTAAFTPLYSMSAAKGATYAAWTGTANRATKDAATATLADVAQTLKALIDDLQARGVI